jgi:SSS family solute:Na+ symporter
VALTLIALAALMCLALGLRARSGHEMGLEQWTVAGRGFGGLFVFLLLAGEIYTTFTFLGGAGYAYGQGAACYYILAYGTLAYVISYFMLPPVWAYARTHHLVSQPDFVARKYAAPWLGVLVALVGVVALVPYLVLQFSGLGVIVEAASYGAIPKAAAIAIGALVTTLYVTVSGVRGSAWTSVVKDTTVLIAAVFLGIYMPLHYHGSITAMFRTLDHARPGFLAFPAAGQSVAWFVSTVLLTCLGFFMWPHSFGACYTARDPNTFRQNAVLLPLYQLVLLFIVFTGFTAVLAVPGLKGAATNTALLKLVVKTFPPWGVGLIGAAGVLTAIVPGSLIMMSASTLFARNIVGALRPGRSDAATVRLAKLLVPVMAIVAAYFAISGSATIVVLLLMGYNFVTQLFPALVCSLMHRNPVTREGAAAGIVVGVGAVIWFSLTKQTLGTLVPDLPQAVRDLNVGIVALLLNAAVCVAVSLATQGRAAALRDAG